MNIKRKIVSTIATGALLLNVLTPFAFADTSIEISGNGAASDSVAVVTTTQTTTVVQDNVANINNIVNANATTGNNDANDNTGGDVMVDTGNATTQVDIENKANANVVETNNCNGCNAETDVKISGNGALSTNNAVVTNDNTTEVFQTNDANIINDVVANARTGGNDANRNTGGDVTIRTGNAETEVEIATQANANIAKLGGRSASSDKSRVSALISGNGAGSVNDIDLLLNRSASLVQDNVADVINIVDANARTGNNRANDNTGGDVMIDTGNARAHVGIDNMVNFSAASLDCCVADVSAKISGNGAESENLILADFLNELSVFQTEDALLDNLPEARVATGNNDAKRNTGSVNGSDDVEVRTGDGESETHITNEANKSIFGSDDSLSLHDLDLDLDFSFNLSALMALLSHMS